MPRTNLMIQIRAATTPSSSSQLPSARTGVIAGIVVAAVIGAILLFVLASVIFVELRRRREARIDNFAMYMAQRRPGQPVTPSTETPHPPTTLNDNKDHESPPVLPPPARTVTFSHEGYANPGAQYNYHPTTNASERQRQQAIGDDFRDPRDSDPSGYAV
ncbi:hypothetical protein BKA62DRAFT_484646 [Auriculariales sp. MPI-PUGE-AT-0066]|nr:hypothetical protein BKA62DRAFT_484646 [Auriculariales sp. MPI-PUGE-AT-0066]